MKSFKNFLSFMGVTVVGSLLVPGLPGLAFAQTTAPAEARATDAIKIKSSPNSIRSCDDDPIVKIEVYPGSRQGEIVVLDLPEYQPSSLVMKLVVLSLVPSPPTPATCATVVKAIKNDVVKWVERYAAKQTAELNVALTDFQTAIKECENENPSADAAKAAAILAAVTQDFGPGTQPINEAIQEVKDAIARSEKASAETLAKDIKSYKASIEEIKALVAKTKVVTAEPAPTFDKAVKKAQKISSALEQEE